MSTGFQIHPGEDARKEPVRLLVVQEDQRPVVDLHDDEMVMTMPHLLVRELIVFAAATIVIVVAALLFDAPLEELANPQKTPNPSKAPWYFLGLQELLHYYSPLISGVVLPGLVMGALVVVPYFNVNLQREPLWNTGRQRKLFGITAFVLAASAAFYYTGAHPVWPLIVPTLAIGAVMVLPGLFGTEGRLLRWLGTRSLAFWIFIWFLVATAVLTAIGVFFRGPGWAFTLPWVHGIY